MQLKNRSGSNVSCHSSPLSTYESRASVSYRFPQGIAWIIKGERSQVHFTTILLPQLVDGEVDNSYGVTLPVLVLPVLGAKYGLPSYDVLCLKYAAPGNAVLPMLSSFSTDEFQT